MATLKSKFIAIKNETGYITGSIFIKSVDDDGAVIKYLINAGSGRADRKEKFFGLDPNEKKSIPKYRNRTVISEIIVNNPI